MFDLASTPAATVDLTLPDANGCAPFSFGRSPVNGLNSNYSNDSNCRLNEEPQSPLRDAPRRTATGAARVQLPRGGDDPTPLHQALGMQVGEHGRYAACPLPGHGGVAWLDAAGGRYGDDLRFWCDCFGHDSQFPGDDSRSDYHRHVADAYHAIQTGRVLAGRGRADDLALELRGYWSMRLARDAGLLAALDLAALPPDAEDDLRRGRDLFGLLCARDRAAGIPRTAFSRGLVQRTLGIGRDRARQVIAALRDAGVIVQVDETPPRGRRAHGTYLYEPGRP